MVMTLTPQTEARVTQALESGRFESVDALIATAMDVLHDSTPANLHELESVIQEGMKSVRTERSYNEEDARSYLSLMKATWK